MIPVVELLRVSTALQAQNLGLPAQHTVNVQTCARHGLQPVASIEIVESGAEVASSPQMARVLELVQSGAARGVVLAEYSRLFRPDRWSDLMVLQCFSDHGAQIYLPTGPIDLQSEIGFVQATVNNMLAALERRRIRERMQRGKEEVRRRGGNVHPIALPLGIVYSRENGWEYTPDIERVKEIFRLFMAGERNHEEIGRRAGVPRTSVGYVLRNPIYSGWRVYDKKRDQTAAGKYAGKGYRRSTKRDPEEVIRVQLPLVPIITEQDFAHVQLLLQPIGLRRRRVADPLRYLYRGFAFCECGFQLYGIISNKPPMPYYMCKSNSKPRRPAGVESCGRGFIRGEVLEAAIDDAITDRLVDVDVIVSAVEAYNDSVADAWRVVQPDVDAIESRVKELQRKRARVVEAFVDGLFGKGERDERLRAIDAEIEAMGGIAALEPSRPAILNADDVVALIRRLASWPSMDRAAKRKSIEALNPAFVVDGANVLGVQLPTDSDIVSPVRMRSSRSRRLRLRS